MDTEAHRYERMHDPARVMALSDGVFAIIITLLVLEVHVPDVGSGQSLVDAIREVRPSFVAFLISFVVVAIAWAGHRDLFALVRRTDRTLVWLNLLYLLPLCLLPFGASLLSRYETEPVALKLYAGLLVAIALTRLIAWLYATGKPQLLFAPIQRDSRWTGAAVIALPGLAYGLAFLVADQTTDVALTIFWAVPVLYFLATAFLHETSFGGQSDFT